MYEFNVKLYEVSIWVTVTNVDGAIRGNFHEPSSDMQIDWEVDEFTDLSDCHEEDKLDYESWAAIQGNKDELRTAIIELIERED